jgi:uncharacterized membrane protein
VKAELEIEFLHEKLDPLRQREAVRMLTEPLQPSASGSRGSDVEGGRPS